VIQRIAAPVSPSLEAALFVQEGAVGAHVGVVYNADTGHRLLHQAWHCDTRDQSVAEVLASNQSVWLVPPALDEDQQNNLRAHAALVANNVRTGLAVHYAFLAKDASIDSAGMPKLGQSLGLSCSTFISRLCAAAQIPLILESSWDLSVMTPARIAEDKAAQELLVKILQADPDPTRQSHGTALSAEVGTARIRAEEVAAASAMSGRPVSFPAVEPQGSALLAEMLQQAAALAATSGETGAAAPPPHATSTT
jgi:hypothetical protein